MKAKFIKSGKYAHVNDPRSPQFYITEDDAEKGKIVGRLSQLTIDTYSELGICELLKGSEAEEIDESEEIENEESEDVTITDVTGEDKKTKRKRGRKNK